MLLTCKIVIKREKLIFRKLINREAKEMEVISIAIESSSLTVGDRSLVISFILFVFYFVPSMRIELITAEPESDIISI